MLWNNHLNMDYVTFVFLISLATFVIGQETCDNPKDVRNGNVFRNPRGNQVTYVCSPDFQLVGEETLECIKGSWSGSPPYCIASNCPQLGLLRHGTIIYNHNMGVATFECDEGFKLIGGSLLLCNLDGWDGELPLCVDENATPRPLTKHEEMLIDADYSCITKEEVVKPPSEKNTLKSTEWAIAKGQPRLYTVYSCMWGYVPVGGDAKMYCKEGKWIGDHPQCKYVGRYFHHKDLPAHLNQKHVSHNEWLQMADYSCLSPSGEVSPPKVANANSEVKVAILDGMPHMYSHYKCEDGYTMKIYNQENQYCLDKQWVGPSIECVRK